MRKQYREREEKIRTPEELRVLMDAHDRFYVPSYEHYVRKIPEWVRRVTISDSDEQAEDIHRYYDGITRDRAQAVKTGRIKILNLGGKGGASLINGQSIRPRPGASQDPEVRLSHLALLVPPEHLEKLKEIRIEKPGFFERWKGTVADYNLFRKILYVYDFERALGDDDFYLLHEFSHVYYYNNKVKYYGFLKTPFLFKYTHGIRDFVIFGLMASLFKLMPSLSFGWGHVFSAAFFFYLLLKGMSLWGQNWAYLIGMDRTDFISNYAAAHPREIFGDSYGGVLSIQKAEKHSRRKLISCQ